MAILRSFTATLEGVSAVLLQWTISSNSNVGGYQVYRADVNESVFSKIADTTPLINYYRDTSVELRKTYQYQVKVMDLNYVNVLESSKPINVSISNISVAGYVKERGSNAPFGLTNIYVENVVTGETFTIKTDEFGNYEAKMLFGVYRFYINDIPGYEVAEEVIKLDNNTLREGVSFKFPNKSVRENIVDEYGPNKDILSGTSTIFRLDRGNIANKFGERGTNTVGNFFDFNSGQKDLVLEGTSSVIKQIDADSGLIVFDKPPMEFLYKTKTVGEIRNNSYRIVVEDASNLKVGNFVRIGYETTNYFIQEINYAQNAITLNEIVPLMPEGTEVKPVILLSYYANDYSELFSIRVHIYLIKTSTKTHLDNIILGLPPSFWNVNITDSNFMRIMQMYAEEYAKINDDINQLQWNNYLYDSTRRDTNYMPATNEGIAPYHEVDRESIYNNFGVYIGRDIKPRQDLDDYRNFVRAVWRILLLGPTGEAKINEEIILESAVGNERKLQTSFYPITPGAYKLMRNNTGLGMGQQLLENLALNPNNVLDGTSYKFKLSNDRIFSPSRKAATSADIVVYGTDKKISAVDPVEGYVYFMDPLTHAELMNGVYVSYWYDNRSFLEEGRDYFIDIDTGQIEIYMDLTAGDSISITYVRRSALREAVELFMNLEKQKKANFTYGVDLKEFFIHNGTQPQLVKRRSLLASDGYSKAGEITPNIEIDNKLMFHPIMHYTNSFFEVKVFIPDSFDFRDEVIEKTISQDSGGQLRARLSSEDIVSDTVKVELVGGSRETTPGFLVRDKDYKYLNNVKINTDDGVAYTENENLIMNGMTNNVQGDMYFKLRHMKLRNFRNDKATINDIIVTGTSAKIKSLDSETGEILFNVQITKEELQAGVYVSYWYDYYSELYTDVTASTFDVIEILLDGGAQDYEEFLTYYYEVGRGLRRKDDDIKWLLNIAKPASTYYDLVFCMNVNQGNDDDVINIDKYLQERNTYEDFRMLLASDLNSLSAAELVKHNKTLAECRVDVSNNKKFYIDNNILLNIFGLQPVPSDFGISGDNIKVQALDYKEGWVEFDKVPQNPLDKIYLTYISDLGKYSLIAGGISFFV